MKERMGRGWWEGRIREGERRQDSRDWVATGPQGSTGLASFCSRGNGTREGPQLAGGPQEHQVGLWFAFLVGKKLVSDQKS